MKLLLLVLVFLGFGGCQSEYRNISDQAEYSSVVGSKYRTLVQFRIHGVSLQRNYRGNIDRYVVTELPGFSGRDVISSTIIEVGTNLTVESVIICISCWPKKSYLVIDLESDSINSNVEVWLDDRSVMTDAGVRVLNPTLFSISK